MPGLSGTAPAQGRGEAPLPGEGAARSGHTRAPQGRRGCQRAAGPTSAATTPSGRHCLEEAACRPCAAWAPPCPAARDKTPLPAQPPQPPSTLPSVPSLTPAFASTLVPRGGKEGDKPPGDKPPPASSNSLAVRPSARSAPGHPRNIVPAGFPWPGEKSHPVRGRERLNTPVEGVQVPAEGLGMCQALSCCSPSHCQGGRPERGTCSHKQAPAELRGTRELVGAKAWPGTGQPPAASQGQGAGGQLCLLPPQPCPRQQERGLS